MNFFQRALKNITRRKTKSILLLITFFVIGNFVIIGLGVSAASESAKILTRQKMRAVVTYNIDYDAVWRYTNQIEDEDELNEFYEKHYPRVTVADVQEILKDERVKTANAIVNSQIYGVDGGIDYVHLNNEAENREGGYGQSCHYDDATGQETCMEYHEPAFFVKANAFPDMIEFADNMYTLTEGRFYTQEEIDNHEAVVLISEALANANNIRLGDTISFYMQDPAYIQEGSWMAGVELDDIRLDLEVIGIYDHHSPITPDNDNYNWLSPYENPDNMLLMPSTVYFDKMLIVSQKQFDYQAQLNPDDEYYSDPANRPSGEMYENYISEVTILLRDPMEVDDFVSEYADKVGEFKKISANNEEFDRLSKPLDTLSLYASFIVWLVVINAIVIITLVTALTLKTREYEIGVLLSIGASKAKIVAQFFAELAIVAILGFTLSIVSGSFIANKVGRTVLDYQITSSGVGEEDEMAGYYNYNSIWDTDYTTEITLDDLVEEYNVNVSPVIIGEIYVVGLGIVLISTIIPSMMIMRFNPKRILMNQN
ncbi:MAG: ABC transporter permease [Erysipelotrichaceae bacterium]|nr:ABC transporter permease [Erysipelotrichaceae bacterium]